MTFEINKFYETILFNCYTYNYLNFFIYLTKFEICLLTVPFMVSIVAVCSIDMNLEKARIVVLYNDNNNLAISHPYCNY